MAASSGRFIAAQLARGERFAHDRGVVERQHPVADDLIRLVTFSGDEHDVARTRFGDRAFDRAPPIELDDVVAIGDSRRRSRR